LQTASYPVTLLTDSTALSTQLTASNAYKLSATEGAGGQLSYNSTHS